MGGKSVITAHVRGNRHKDTTEACSSRLVTSFFRPQVSQSVTQFVVAHNLAFNASNHAINLFPKMFPDSEAAKKFCLWMWGTALLLLQGVGGMPRFRRENGKTDQPKGPWLGKVVSEILGLGSQSNPESWTR